MSLAKNPLTVSASMKYSLTNLSWPFTCVHYSKKTSKEGREACLAFSVGLVDMYGQV